ncbi:hypothetical protein E2C01_042507 [Portunus trituberculatus]|uniref:Uncharacterized protein n=1 Tax=Portunus trituberculatus TaxID=210409 RepID=A0A5B7FWP2_PORTR|nr:hypothetical protein [Portunus trituberculatus]
MPSWSISRRVGLPVHSNCFIIFCSVICKYGIQNRKYRGTRGIWRSNGGYWGRQEEVVVFFGVVGTTRGCCLRVGGKEQLGRHVGPRRGLSLPRDARVPASPLPPEMERDDGRREWRV